LEHYFRQHAVQGSNLPPLGLEPRIPPLKNFRRVVCQGFAQRTL
jgi:hypothetical protein